MTPGFQVAISRLEGQWPEFISENPQDSESAAIACIPKILPEQSYFVICHIAAEAAPTS